MEQPRTVLIVDDDPDTLELVTAYLARQEFRVATASRWTDALDRLQEERPDLVLLDLYLPTVQGEALLEFIREQYPDLPVVILSARIDAGQIEHLGRIGASGFIRKPFEADDLLIVVEQALLESGRSAPELAQQSEKGGPPDLVALALSPPEPPLAPSPVRRVSPGAGVETLERSRIAAQKVRRRRIKKRRGGALKRIRNYLLAFILFALIGLLVWTMQKTLTSGFFGIGIQTIQEQSK